MDHQTDFGCPCSPSTDCAKFLALTPCNRDISVEEVSTSTRAPVGTIAGAKKWEGLPSNSH